MLPPYESAAVYALQVTVIATPSPVQLFPVRRAIKDVSRIIGFQILLPSGVSPLCAQAGTASVPAKIEAYIFLLPCLLRERINFLPSIGRLRGVKWESARIIPRIVLSNRANNLDVMIVIGSIFASSWRQSLTWRRSFRVAETVKAETRGPQVSGYCPRRDKGMAQGILERSQV